jgi:hypothetical protein
MTPRFSAPRVSNRCSRDAELYGDLLMRAGRAANPSDLFVGQLGAPLLFAACPTAFPNFVRDVIGMGAKEQMGRIDAGPVIARVTNAHPIWDLAVRYFPCGAVRPNLPVIRTFTSDFSVAGGPNVSRPRPAHIRIGEVSQFFCYAQQVVAAVCQAFHFITVGTH